jgi:6-pyruvoyltetrahydropterin/6-carboxytetrahydropterin synthase
MLTTMIEISGGPFVFSAAHAGLHGGEFEPLHGHTFTLTVRLRGDIDQDGMVADFGLVKKAMAEVIAPLKRRTLMPGAAPGVDYWSEDGQLFITAGGRRFSLPAEDVAMLPLANTTTEAIAAHLADQLLPHLRDEPGVGVLEVELAEAADTAAVITLDAGARAPARAPGS